MDLTRLGSALSAIYPAHELELALTVELHERSHWYETRYVPWIDSTLPLSGCRMVEIGTGTGSSAIPFARKGANVLGIDIHQRALDVAHVRAQTFGVADRFSTHCGNGADLAGIVGSQKFDIAIFSASLEHMTYRERMAALKAAWQSVRIGGYLAIVDSPNRLWFFDNHTAMTNFFHWLPDELASAYAKRTPRMGFNDAAHTEVELARWGRGVSFHDVEIALDLDVRELAIEGEWAYRRKLHPEWAAAWLASANGRYHEFLKAASPDVPASFLEEEIAVLIRKRLHRGES